MASNREERFLMRQRGAGTRQIKAFGFGIALPGTPIAPLKPPPSGKSRRTPQPQLQPQRSSRRTPNPRSLLPRVSIRRASATSHSKVSERPSPFDLPVTENKNQSSSSQATRRDGMGSVTKKRRLLAASQDSQALSQGSTQDEAVSAVVEAENETIPVDVTIAIRTSDGILGHTTVLDSGDNETPPIVKASPTRKLKKRKSIAQKSRKRVKLSPQESLQQSVTPFQATAGSSVFLSQGVIEPAIVASGAEATKLPSSNTGKKPRRKKRKSIGKIPKNRKRSLEIAQSRVSSLDGQSQDANQGQKNASGSVVSEPLISSKQTRMRLSQVEEEEDDGEIEEESAENSIQDNAGEEVDEREAPPSKRPKKTQAGSSEIKQRGRRKTSDVQNQTESRAQATSTAKSVVHPPKRQVRRAVRATSSVAEDLEETRPSRSQDAAIPITVSRMSRVQASEDEDGDVLAGLAPFPKKGRVNAFDMLSQSCREIIDEIIDTLNQGAQKERHEKQKAEWRRKRKVTKVFADELDARLFQLSEAVDNNHALKTRLRKANKKKVALREQLLDLRRQREEVELRIDEVRIKHENATKIANDKNDINTLIQDIELAVQRGRAQQSREEIPEGEAKPASGLEFRLRDIASKVSSVEGGGLLAQVKDYNALLERTIAAF